MVIVCCITRSYELRIDFRIKAKALDKLLGQLGIYATWLSSIAYLQKQLRIFLRHVFGSDYICFLIK